MRVIWGNRIFGGGNLQLGVLVLIILLADSLTLQQEGKVWLCGLGVQGRLAVGVAGSGAEAVFSLLLCSLWVGLTWPLYSRRNGPGMMVLLGLEPWFPSVNHFIWPRLAQLRSRAHPVGKGGGAL